MRFSKHVLPIAILLTGVIAAKDEESTTAVEKAKATDDKASATADDSKTADATEEASATATGKDDKKESKTDKSDTKSATKEKSAAASQTTADGPTITWDPPAPKTTVPDINAGSPSPMTPGVVVLSLVLGITSLGMALL
ncbi:hypothetical protein H9Q69_003891 [Fusarium xylarioides]|uniref:Cell wall protein n=1 Tax=Fusarium xylarioides TaxID=221167 RepID=A0A9P7IJN4_9HYPO|nr:hypothetical protein H9Q70_004182 [Fusarium xylarioides]KAG5757592.1 hypothetical protein H9Q72_014269 [Fusarium xylarioides]KAG5784883.1 hypothetical protein H9Q73_001510 [Fusarium xylarioides]KAG5797063.1 hypothetical protein H9Q69_003891 [Fusarium xylarioides]KAG5809275.1 hypothetical protein H9Q71_006321 [Fusarium xylarioides]